MRVKFPENLAASNKHAGLPIPKTAVIRRAKQFFMHAKALKFSPHSIFITHLPSVVLTYEVSKGQLWVEFFNDRKQSWTLSLPNETLAAEFTRFPEKLFKK